MSTVNISFNDDLLKQIDKVAEEESRSRSELIREAARSYIERKRKWGQIFQLGKQIARAKGLSQEDVEKEIASFRKERRR
jgi:metal-responsive CopG/Arc/MetJ family transcriptional regulator